MLIMKFLPALTLLFIGLKLGGVISWSWGIVLLPILIPLGFVVVFGTLCLIIAAAQRA